MTTTLKPLWDRIVVELAAISEKPSKVIIPDKYKMAPNEGIVLAVGPGRWDAGALVPMTVKPGDHVLVQEGRGVDFAADGKVLRIMEEGGVMAIIERASMVLPS